MVLCRHCSIPNSLDSTFCKRCGTALPEDDLQEAQTKLDALIAEGMSSLNAGKVEESTAIAETAIASNPSSVAALTLKANCHERHGEIAEALECAEKIVELNPDSELDKITRNRLRSALMAQAKRDAPTDRRLAFIGAAAAVVLVVCTGAIWAKVSKDNRDKALLAENTPIASISTPTSGQPTGTNSANTPATPNGAGTNTNPQGSQTAPATAPRENEVPAVSNRQDGTLPPATIHLPLTTAPPIETDVRPVNPNGPTTPPSTNPPSNPKTAPGGGGDGTDPPPSTVPTGPSQPVDSGTYEITVHRGAANSVGGSQPVSAGGVEAYIRTGRSQYQLRNYAGAASNFETALRNGADPTTINMRLGQSYEKMGRTSDAVSAYTRAIRACDQAIAAGKANNSLRATADACRQAVKVLQGG